MSDITRAEAIGQFLEDVYKLGFMQPHDEVPNNILNRLVAGELAADRELSAVRDSSPRIYAKYLQERNRWRQVRCKVEELFPGCQLDRLISKGMDEARPPSPNP
jgi:hypothetical protein